MFLHNRAVAKDDSGQSLYFSLLYQVPIYLGKRGVAFQRDECLMALNP